MTLANSRFAFNIAALMNRRGKFSVVRAFTKKTFSPEGGRGKAGNYLTYIWIFFSFSVDFSIIGWKMVLLLFWVFSFFHFFFVHIINVAVTWTLKLYNFKCKFFSLFLRIQIVQKRAYIYWMTDRYVYIVDGIMLIWKKKLIMPVIEGKAAFN